MQVLQEDLKVMDASAISLCRENKIPIIVFSINEAGGFAKVMTGEGSYSIVTEKEEHDGRTTRYG